MAWGQLKPTFLFKMSLSGDFLYFVLKGENWDIEEFKNLKREPYLRDHYIQSDKDLDKLLKTVTIQLRQYYFYFGTKTFQLKFVNTIGFS